MFGDMPWAWCIRMSEKESLVESIGLLEIDPRRLEKNPENPRLIFDKEDLDILRESIRESGILVPLLVYRRKTDGKYVILDGERRWMCALDLGLETLPANVIDEPTQTTNILTMFNIHNVRTQWEPMPTALKLEVLIRLLKVKNPRRGENLKKLAQLTGMSQRGVEHALNLLSYPKKYQDLMLTGDKEERVKADFFDELYPVLNLIEKNLPEISSKYSRNDITDKLLTKYRSGTISSARDFRQVADIIRAVKKGLPKYLAIPQIESLIQEPKITITEAYGESSKIFYDLQFLESTARDFRNHLSKIDPKDLVEHEKLLQILDELKHIIESLLYKAREIMEQTR